MFRHWNITYPKSEDNLSQCTDQVNCETSIKERGLKFLVNCKLLMHSKRYFGIYAFVILSLTSRTGNIVTFQFEIKHLSPQISSSEEFA